MSDEYPDRSLRVATAVEPKGDDRYAAVVSAQYNVAQHPNGGYLQCVMANAALAAASAQGAHHVHPTSVTTNFVGSPENGPAELTVDVRRVGRGVSFVHVAMAQGGQVTTESVITLGTIDDASVARYTDAPRPSLRPYDELTRLPSQDARDIMQVLDIRLDPANPFVASDRGELRGWLRLDDGERDWEPASLLFASDALPPATFPLGSSGWVPTLQLTSYVHAIPSGAWLRARQWCVVVADGTVSERCEIFDKREVLVASSSQLAMVRFPRSH